MKIVPFFPNSVWSGSTTSRPDVRRDQLADHHDADRLIQEVIAIENYLLNVDLPLLFVTGPPDNSLGRDGQFAIDYENLVIYGPKNGTWPSGISFAPDVSWDDITDKPDTFPPSSHAETHELGGSDELSLAQSQVVDLVTALASKLALTGGELSGGLTINTPGSLPLSIGPIGKRVTFDVTNLLTAQQIGFPNATGVLALRDVSNDWSASQTFPNVTISGGLTHLGTSGFQLGANAFSFDPDFFEQFEMTYPLVLPTESPGANSTKAATTAFVATAVANAIAALLDSAPGALDTLNELAAAIADDANFSATVTNSIALKLAIASNLSEIAGNGGVAQAAARTNLGLGSVENTALSTWVGTVQITTLGTIVTGVWHGTAVAADHGGTGQTTYVSGNILYANSTTTLAKLAPNVTTTRKFLKQVGNGSAAFQPDWDTIGAGDLPATVVYQASNSGVVGVTIDGGGGVITTGQKGYFNCPFAGTIVSATLVSDITGSIVIDVWKLAFSTSALPTVANSITASAKPTLSSAKGSQNTTLTGWTTAVTAGDTFGFNVDSASLLTKATLVLKILKS